MDVKIVPVDVPTPAANGHGCRCFFYPEGGGPVVAKEKYKRWLEPEALVLLEGWARDGLTDEDIAHNMGVRSETLCRWKSSYAQINQALKKGKEVADYIVENALYKSAIGYDVEEYEEKVDQKGNVVPTIKRRHIPANTTAQIFWLKNRKPDRWRDKPVETVDEEKVLRVAAALLEGVNSAIE